MTCRRSIVSIGAIALCVLAYCPDVHGAEPKRVLALHSLELVPQSASSMRAELVKQSRAPVVIDDASPPIAHANDANEEARLEAANLQRWKISESRLPPGSEDQFREPTIWERYRLQALAVCAALLMQAGLISLLVHEHRSRERAELVSRKSAAELARMNRLTAAGELSASIAHEVSQPLTGISARASAALHWLSAEKPDVTKIRGALNDIINATHRADDIISSIRLTLKKGEQEKRPVHINHLIEVVLPIVQADLNKEGVELRLDLDSNLELLEVDATQLQQVILNLITNAVEAMHSVPSRILTISTQQTAPGIVRMSIEDTGPGVDRENSDRIFDRLFTTKPSGMGMGLSICRSIIERHGGHISVSKGVNGGAIFQIELPSIRRAVTSTSILTRSLVRSN
jgi:signal transduction histidine kinase